jgi:protein involved in polysaccharide export with SLBB domain
VERIELDSALNLGAKGDFVLKPGDVVIVRPNPDIQTTRTVILKGEWTFPGVYALESRADRLSTVMGRAGGLSRQADLRGVYIIRNEFDRPKIQNDISYKLDDNVSEANITSNSIDTIAITAFSRRLKNWNYSLKDGDEIVALEKKSDVRVTGAVQNPTIIMHNQSKRINFYVNSAGGTTNFGKIRKSYVKYPNGMGRKSKNFLFFAVYPKVPPGSSVIVPMELELPTQEKKFDPAEVAMYSAVLGFFSSTILSLVVLLR